MVNAQSRESAYPGCGPLTKADCDAVHAASLEILETVGVRLESPEAVQTLARAGVRVTNEDCVHISASQVEWALAKAPSSITICNRDGQPALTLDGRRTYFGPGSDALNIVDHRSGERRQPVLQDVRDVASVCQQLPNIDFVMSLFLPVDVDSTITDRCQMQVLLNGTTKPIIFVTYDLEGCKDVVRMAEAVAGDAAALREAPFIACYINTTNGLLHNSDAVGKLMYLAERGIPSLYIPGCIAGVSGPATVAGSVAIINAGTLAGLVLSQVVREGAPFVMKGWGGGGLDMRTAVYGYAGPDSRRLASRMARYYDLPSFAVGGASDAKLVDEQAAAEAALSVLSDAWAGADLVHDLGYLESGMSASLALLTICDEIVAWTRKYLDPVDVSPEALAVDAIRQVGSQGTFLAAKHTSAHYKEMWQPRLFERTSYETWAQDGRHGLRERASAKVEALLQERPDVSLPGSVNAVLTKVVEDAGAKAALTAASAAARL